ncbi:uncharacterized protein LOC135464916 [Liolophura sinensis]|uniref:uncharacterized protein LOC135464916 n=1 Tax=Liolophura sinensis TaxID=3198878 RepID=UPI00315978B7
MMVSTMSTCSAGHVLEWKSQATHNSLPWGNLTTAAAIFFSGSNASKVIRLFEILKLQTFSKRTFFRIQKSYLVPSVVEVWNFERERNVVERLGKQLILGGDARCDSPGYSAKYGSYSLMDLDSQTVLDIQLIQCNEVKGSTHMELEGLKRGLLKLKAERLNIKSLITDRHVMVKKFMKGEEEIIHNFDVWHFAKGVSKKLEGLAKKKGAEAIKPWIKSVSTHLYWAASTSANDGEMKLAKWQSLTRHIRNIHTHPSKRYPECRHGPLEDNQRNWMEEGTCQN